MACFDPPHTVAYEGGTAAKMTIANDALGSGFLDFLRPALADVLQVTKGACYVCMSASEWPTLHRARQQATGAAAVLDGEERTFNDIAEVRTSQVAEPG
ncbi:hypothetical protein ACFQS7_17905 [Dankookia sp. GCM10030260]